MEHKQCHTKRTTLVPVLTLLQLLGHTGQKSESKAERSQAAKNTAGCIHKLYAGLPSLLETICAKQFPDEEEEGLTAVSALKDSFVGKDLFPGCRGHPSDFIWTVKFFLGLLKNKQTNKNNKTPTNTPPALMNRYHFWEHFIKQHRSI